MDRTSVDVCLKQSPESYMKQTLQIMFWRTVSIAIPNLVTVKTQSLLHSEWLSVPTSA